MGSARAGRNSNGNRRYPLHVRFKEEYHYVYENYEEQEAETLVSGETFRMGLVSDFMARLAYDPLVRCRAYLHGFPYQLSRAFNFGLSVRLRLVLRHTDDPLPYRVLCKRRTPSLELGTLAKWITAVGLADTIDELGFIINPYQ